MTHHYSVYGLRLESERRLPLLWPAAPEPADVCICFAAVTPPDSPPVFKARAVGVQADGTAYLTPPGGPRIRIEAGCRITVDQPDGVNDAELQSWLFGPAMAVLHHQRGRPALHAAAVVIGGRAVVLAGDSGAGKSTTALALLRRGHRLLSDDQALIDPDTRLVASGVPSIKLWGAAAEFMGWPVDSSLRARPGLDKYHVPLKDEFHPSPVALGSILVLRSGEEADASGDGTMEAGTMEAGLAAALLHRMIQRPGVAQALDQGRSAFEWSTAMARWAPVSILHRPEGLGDLDALCRRIEAKVEA